MYSFACTYIEYSALWCLGVNECSRYAQNMLKMCSKHAQDMLKTQHVQSLLAHQGAVQGTCVISAGLLLPWLVLLLQYIYGAFLSTVAGSGVDARRAKIHIKLSKVTISEVG